LWQRSLNYENIPPLAPALDRLVMNLFGESEWSFRLSAAACFPLAILASYFFGKEFRDPTFGGLCALVTAWNPLALGEIRIARCYSLTLLLSVLCFWMAVRWIRRPYDHYWAFLWALTSVAVIWTHYLNAAVVGATLVGIVWRVPTRSVRGFVFLVIGVLAIVLSVSPLFPALMRMADWGKHFGFQTESSFFETVSEMWWLGLPVGLIVRYASQRLHPQSSEIESRRISRVAWVLLLGWGLAPTLAALVLGHGELASLANPRYRTGFQIVAGCGLVAILANGLSPRTSVVVIISALIASWSVTDHMPWSPKRLSTRQSSQWKEMALYVEEHGQPGEPIFVQSGLGEGFLLPALYEDLVLHDYVACRLGRMYIKTEHPRYGLPFRFDLNDAMLRYYVELVSSIKETPHQSLWIAAATDTDLNQMSGDFFLDLTQKLGFAVVDRKETQDAVLIHLKFRKEN
jgi:4-amino-4-deoxy-L-arabinose transferase-like glycosyltransferase